MSGGDPRGRARAAALNLFLVAGEHSGDTLGAKLIAALKAQHGGEIRFSGIGGEQMAAQGFASLFPLSDVAVMGPLAILKRLAPIVRRVHRRSLRRSPPDPMRSSSSTARSLRTRLRSGFGGDGRASPSSTT